MCWKRRCVSCEEQKCALRTTESIRKRLETLFMLHGNLAQSSQTSERTGFFLKKYFTQVLKSEITISPKTIVTPLLDAEAVIDLLSDSKLSSDFTWQAEKLRLGISLVFPDTETTLVSDETLVDVTKDRGVTCASGESDTESPSPRKRSGQGQIPRARSVFLRTRAQF
jgi:hypothetical protein